jgi:hypothetical protein
MSGSAAAGVFPSLYEMFLKVPDPRDPSGRRHPLASMLTLSVTAILAGAKTLTDIAIFGCRRRRLCKLMGFKRKPPCISTYHYLFKELDAEVFEQTVQEWMLGHHRREGVDELHMDGKTLRGSRRGEVPGVHLLAVHSEQLGAPLREIPVNAKTNEHKAALELLGLIPLQGVLITGDAMFAQREIAEQIIAGGGDYLVTVKDNQPSLKQALQDAFDAPLSPAGESVPASGPANSDDA